MEGLPTLFLMIAFFYLQFCFYSQSFETHHCQQDLFTFSFESGSPTSLLVHLLGGADLQDWLLADSTIHMVACFRNFHCSRLLLLAMGPEGWRAASSSHEYFQLQLHHPTESHLILSPPLIPTPQVSATQGPRLGQSIFPSLRNESGLAFFFVPLSKSG